MQEILMEADYRRKLWYQKDPVTGLVTIRTEWNNDTPLTLAKDMRKDAVSGFKDTRKNQGAHYVAHIPAAVIPELVARGICRPGGDIIDLKALLKWLSQSEQEPFRIKKGRLG